MASKTEDVEVKSTTRELPVKLTKDEMIGKATKLGKVMEDINEEASEKSKFLGDWRAKDKHLKKTRDELLENVRTQTEQRDIPCQAEFNYTRGAITIKREDTGEVVDTRPMTVDERQRSLPEGVE